MRMFTQIAAGSMFAIALTTPAVGQSVQEHDVRVIRTTDLDLSTALGRKRLDHRVVVAAYDVCGVASDADLVAQNAARKCRHDVLRTARQRLQHLASGKTNTRPAS